MATAMDPAAAKKQFSALLDAANKRFIKLHARLSEYAPFASALSPLFNKTFESFSKLWQFQMSHRPALLESGLQRSDLGGIASKIGQLYYNYYLRSGDTVSLTESYTFYDAIHSRSYFAANPADAPDPAAACRQMRFYARFVVVCLMLNRKEEAMQLLQELQAMVRAYGLQFSAPDAADWQGVVGEVGALMAADVAMPMPRSPGSVEVPFKPPLRCRLAGPAATCAPHRPRLREALMVSYRTRQVKVAELPIELYRMAQALEWQDRLTGAAAAAAAVAGEGSGSSPADAAAAANVSTAPSGRGGGSANADVTVGLSSGSGGAVDGVAAPAAVAASGRGVAAGPGPGSSSSSSSSSSGPRNPPRLLLHKPTAQQLLSSLLSLTAPLPPPGESDDFVLLYLNADAAPPPPPPAPSGPTAAASQPSGPRQMQLCPAVRQVHHHAPSGSGGASTSAAAGGGKAGGSAPAAAPSAAAPSAAPSAAPASAAVCSSDALLSPEELLVATRRRLLLLVDSNMSTDFGRLVGRERSAPLLCLMSPTTPLPPPPGLSSSSAATASASASASSSSPASASSSANRYGSLTTMALACPAQALCVLCEEPDPAPAALQRLQDVLDEVMLALGRGMAEQLAQTGTGAGTSGLGEPPAWAAWAPVFGDALARRLLLHFAFFRAAMALLPATDGGAAAALMPSTSPPLPPAADAAGAVLRAGVLRAAQALGRGGVFVGGSVSAGVTEGGAAVAAAAAAASGLASLSLVV